MDNSYSLNSSLSPNDGVWSNAYASKRPEERRNFDIRFDGGANPVKSDYNGYFNDNGWKMGPSGIQSIGGIYSIYNWGKTGKTNKNNTNSDNNRLFSDDGTKSGEDITQEDLKRQPFGSLSEELLTTVVGMDAARDIWTKLKSTLTPPSQEPIQPSDGTVKITAAEAAVSTKKDKRWYLPLYKAALRGDWESAKRIFDQDNDALTAEITSYSETALHVAVGTGKAIDFVENMVAWMPKDALSLQDRRGNTAFSLAAIVGNTKAAIILLNKNPALPYIRNKHNELPIYLAAIYAHRDMLSYLLGVMKEDVEPNPFADQSGVELLISMIDYEFFDMAVELLIRFPHLATMKTSDNKSPLIAISEKASAFLSGRSQNLLESLIYSCVPIKLHKCSNKNNCDVENLNGNSDMLWQVSDDIQWLKGNYINSVCQALHVQIWEVIGLAVPRIKHIQQQKLVHHQVLQLVKCLCEQIKLLNDHDSYKHHYTAPILLAASLGIHEIVEEVVDTFPDAVWTTNNNDQSIFQLAVIHRCEKVFNLIYQMSEHRYCLTEVIDNSGNNILHLAGRLAPPNKLNLVSGAALQMQRELQWFKEVEKFASTTFVNHSGETAAAMFSREHKGLVIQGQSWMKETANSCSIAAALIITVAFTAAITVPGGNNGGSGLPIFSTQVPFMIFMVSDAISLFTSTTSLLMFLSILTARYAGQDFLYALPKRLIIGLVTLFLSITSMMIAFSATLYLAFGQRKAWILTPVAAFACLPITSFVFLQFPLLVDVISSTYGKGIFGKQSDRLFY